MKKSLFIIFFVLFQFTVSAQSGQVAGKEVYTGDDVVFHQIDDHTWVGTGHMMSNESLYLIEGSDKAILIDAGTNIADLDKIVASITGKPVTLVVTHVHPDHTGSAINYWNEIYIHPADTVNIPAFMPDYKGEIKFISEGDVFDLGGRQILVVHTPGHTPGSLVFMDYGQGYGFSGDSFGSGNLLLSTDFTTLLGTCKKMKAIIEEHNINLLYPGHYFGTNGETPQRINDMITICEGILSGELQGKANPRPMMGLNMIITAYGMNINYSSDNVK